jgi:acetyl-CoA carboxylase biotin carboxyl carrier protein
VKLSDEDVREILRIIDESAVDELRLEFSGFSLHVRRGEGPALAAGANAEPSGAGAAVARGPSPVATAPEPDGSMVIEAPMLGTFYTAEGPGDPPFVKVGDHVEADTVVCLIEVMKLMNHIQAGVAGVVGEVLAGNGTIVEFGAPLFRVAVSE